MTRAVRALTRIAFLTAVISVGAGCASPTLPLPPPELPSISTASTPGKYHLTSDRGAEPNAVIVIYNRNASVPLDQRVSGAQADGNGTWDADVIASPGDYLDITQMVDATTSPPLTMQIPR